MGCRADRQQTMDDGRRDVLWAMARRADACSVGLVYVAGRAVCPCDQQGAPVEAQPGWRRPAPRADESASLWPPRLSWPAALTSAPVRPV